MLPAGAADAAVPLIKKFEGFRFTAYQDQGGVWTIGYGATGPDIGSGTVWAQHQADEDLVDRVSDLAGQVGVAVKVPVSVNQGAALLSLAYNIGLGAFVNSHLVSHLNAGDYAGAADLFLVWDHIHGEINAGLSKRRALEKALFLTP